MDPMTQMQQNPLFQWWNTALQGQIRNLTALTGEIQRLEEKSIEHAQKAVDETARLTKEALTAATQMQAAWRKMAIDATQQPAATE